MTTDLPSFTNPPVVETVLGVQFQPVGVSNGHLGGFWHTLRPDWPTVVDQPLIVLAFERFQRSWAPIGEIQLNLSPKPSGRLQITNTAGDAMIQVQDSRFHYNWLGRGGGAYRRYANVRPEFDRYWSAFTEFLGREGFDELEPNQWEVTYVNHIPRGELWDDPQDLTGVFHGLSWPPSGPPGIRLEGLHGRWHFEIEPELGRLHVEFHRGKAQTGADVLVMKLTARGPVNAERELGGGLDIGHQAIVRSFEGFTSAGAHQFWGIET